MKKLFGLIALTAMVVLSSCSKEQRVANKLEGTWVLKSIAQTEDGITETLTVTGVEYQFDKCKTKDNEFCSGRVTYIIDGGDVEAFEYKIISDGDEFITRLPGASNDEVVNKIDDISKKEFTASHSFSNGYSATMKFEKKD